MKNIYACLLGQWCNLSEDHTCIIDNTTNPNTWWEEYGTDMFKVLICLNLTILISHIKVKITVFIQALFKLLQNKFFF